LRVRALARSAAEAYVASRGALGFPQADPDLAAAALAQLAAAQGETA
jgi:glycyl-tRNA synthetase alpha chain